MRLATRDSLQLTVEPVSELESLRDEWARLAAPLEDVFATPDWAITWWRHFHADKTLRTYACRDASGALVAVLPLFEASARRRRVVRLLGSGHSDRTAPVCAPAHRSETAAGLCRALGDGCDVFVADAVPIDEGWPDLLGGRITRRQNSPVIRGGDWEALLARRTHNFRSQVRRLERRLARTYEVSYRLVTGGDELDAALDDLFSLHRARWSVEPVESAFATDEAFHRDFAHVAADRGWLRIWIMELDGEPVAAWYGFQVGSVVAYYQAGRDPAYDSDRVGNVLFAHTVRNALDGGAHEYRMLRGGEGYKQRFADEDAGIATVTVAAGMTGRAYLAAVAGAGRLPAPGRRALKALAGRA